MDYRDAVKKYLVEHYPEIAHDEQIPAVFLDRRVSGLGRLARGYENTLWTPETCAKDFVSRLIEAKPMRVCLKSLEFATVGNVVHLTSWFIQ